MSLQTTINYDTPGNFTFDSGKIEIAGGKAQLKLQENAENFNEDFASDTGFTYDSGKTEFSGGQVQQKLIIESGETFRALYDTDLNAEYADGSATGTGAGGASVSGGKLDLKGHTNQYVDYAGASNGDHAQVGAIRLKVTPNYSTAPVGHTQFFITIGELGQARNTIGIQHDTVSGNIRMVMIDSVGTVQTAILGAWAPTAGVEYEFELNYDFTAGAQRLFIDGVQFGSTQTKVLTRSAAALDTIRVGQTTHTDPPSTSFEPNFEIQDVQVFSTVQHTSNYTPATLASLYQSDTITLPAFSHVGPAGSTIKAFDSFSTTEGGAPRYTVQVDGGGYEYWNGSAWAASDGTYAQASTASDINTNIGTLSGADGATSLTVRIHTTDNDANQASVDDLTWGTTAETTYPTDDPSIVVNSGQLMDGLEGFSATTTAAGSDSVTFILGVDGVDKYWDGAAWSNSDGTLAQSNSAADVETNKAALDVSSGATVKVKALLHSDDGTTTPDITSVTLDYNFFISEPTKPTECIVYGWLIDPGGDAISGGTVRAYVRESFKHGSHVIQIGTTQATTASDGYWEMSLVETETIGKTMDFEAFQTDANLSERRVNEWEAIQIPNKATESFVNLI